MCTPVVALLAGLVDLRIFKAWTMMCGLHAPGGGWHPVVELLDEVLCDLDWEADMCITDRLRFTERGHEQRIMTVCISARAFRKRN